MNTDALSAGSGDLSRRKIQMNDTIFRILILGLTVVALAISAYLRAKAKRAEQDK